MSLLSFYLSMIFTVSRRKTKCQKHLDMFFFIFDKKWFLIFLLLHFFFCIILHNFVCVWVLLSCSFLLDMVNSAILTSKDCEPCTLRVTFILDAMTQTWASSYFFYSTNWWSEQKLQATNKSFLLQLSLFCTVCCCLLKFIQVFYILYFYFLFRQNARQVLNFKIEECCME